MIKYILILLLLAQTCSADENALLFEGRVDRFNSVMIEVEEVNKLIKTYMNTKVGNIDVICDGEPYEGSYVWFLVGEASSSSKEKLSEEFLSDYEGNLVRGVETVRVANRCEFKTKTSDGLTLQFHWQTDGWGSDRLSWLEELYIIARSEESYIPYLPKRKLKSKARFKSYLEHKYPPRQDDHLSVIAQIGDEITILTFLQKPVDSPLNSSAVEAVGKIYFEHYGKSLTISYIGSSEQKINRLSIYSICVHLANLIGNQCLEKGIKSDDVILKRIREERELVTGKKELPTLITSSATKINPQSFESRQMKEVSEPDEMNSSKFLWISLGLGILMMTVGLLYKWKAKKVIQ